MSDKVQKIRQEIERLINDKTDGKHVAKADITAPKRSAYLDILNFIDSLPEESGCEVNCTTKSEDLEEELHSWMKENCDNNGFFNQLELARHFAEWQKEKHNKQFGFLNLKDCKDAYNEWKSTQDNPSAALAWVRACEWQKQKMIRDAVESIVEDWCGDSPDVTIPLNPQYFKTGDKVKIIIVKED